MQVAKRARPIIVYGAIVALAAPGRFVPARYRSGTLPQIPRANSGGEAFLELTVSSSSGVRAVRKLRATPPFTDAMSVSVKAALQSAETTSLVQLRQPSFVSVA